METAYVITGVRKTDVAQFPLGEDMFQEINTREIRKSVRKNGGKIYG